MINMREGLWLQVGAAWGFLAVAMGAFGAHGLKERLDSLGQAANFQTAAQYQMYCAWRSWPWACSRFSGRTGTAVTVAGWSFLLGSADLLRQPLRPVPDRAEMARRNHPDRRRAHAGRLGGPGRGGRGFSWQVT